MMKIKRGDCVIHYITEKAGGKAFVSTSKAAGSAEVIDKADSLSRFERIGGDLSYIEERFSRYEEFYVDPLENFIDLRSL